MLPNPPTGMYWLHLQCKKCSAKKTILHTLGDRLEPGDKLNEGRNLSRGLGNYSAATCIRCKTKNLYAIDPNTSSNTQNEEE